MKPYPIIPTLTVLELAIAAPLADRCLRLQTLAPVHVLVAVGVDLDHRAEGIGAVDHLVLARRRPLQPDVGQLPAARLDDAPHRALDVRVGDAEMEDAVLPELDRIRSPLVRRVDQLEELEAEAVAVDHVRLAHLAEGRSEHVARLRPARRGAGDAVGAGDQAEPEHPLVPCDGRIDVGNADADVIEGSWRDRAHIGLRLIRQSTRRRRAATCR